jgi:hypothetical protein
MSFLKNPWEALGRGGGASGGFGVLTPELLGQAIDRIGDTGTEAGLDLLVGDAEILAQVVQEDDAEAVLGVGERGEDGAHVVPDGDLMIERGSDRVLAEADMVGSGEVQGLKRLDVVAAMEPIAQCDLTFGGSGHLRVHDILPRI